MIVISINLTLSTAGILNTAITSSFAFLSTLAKTFPSSVFCQFHQKKMFFGIEKSQAPQRYFTFSNHSIQDHFHILSTVKSAFLYTVQLSLNIRCTIFEIFLNKFSDVQFHHCTRCTHFIHVLHFQCPYISNILYVSFSVLSSTYVDRRFHL